MRKRRSAVRIVWSAIYPPLLYYAITILVEFVIIIMMMVSYVSTYQISWADFNNQAVMNNLLNDIYANTMLITMVAAFFSCCVLMPLYGADLRRRRQEGRPEILSTATAPKLFWILPLAVATCLGLNLLCSLIPDSLAASYEETAQLMYSSRLDIMILATVVFGPMVEETVFRGLMYGRLRELMGFWPAALLSAFLFGLFHMNFVQFVYAGLMGLVLVFVYERYQSLWASILMHAAANAFSCILQYIETPVSVYYTWTQYFAVMGCCFVLMAMMLLVIHRQVKTVEAGGV